MSGVFPKKTPPGTPLKTPRELENRRNYKILFEDRYSRTYDIRIPAHMREPRHTHHDRVVICLSGAQLEHILADGRTQPSTLMTDEVAWRLGQTHVGCNVGDTDLWAIAVEPK